MTNPVGNLDIELDFDLNERSLNKVAKKLQKFSDKLFSFKDLNLGEGIHSEFSKGIGSLSKGYKGFLRSIQKSYGLNSSQAKEIAKQTLGNNAFAMRLLEKGDSKSIKSKQWSLNQLVSKKKDYDFWKSYYEEKGYEGTSLTRKINSAMGAKGYTQALRKHKEEVKEIELLKKKNKEEEKATKNLSRFSDTAKSFSKGIIKGALSVAGITGVTTLAGKALTGFIEGTINKAEDVATYDNPAQVIAIKKAMGILGGEYWKTAEGEKRATASFRYIGSQITPQGFEHAASIAASTFGAGSQYLPEYINLLKSSAKSGKPNYKSYYQLVEKIAKDKNLSAEYKKRYSSFILGDEKIASDMLEAIASGATDFSELYNLFEPSALVGAEEGKTAIAAGIKTRLAQYKEGEAIRIRNEMKKKLKGISLEEKKKLLKDNPSFYSSFPAEFEQAKQSMENSAALGKLNSMIGAKNYSTAEDISVNVYNTITKDGTETSITAVKNGKQMNVTNYRSQTISK